MNAIEPSSDVLQIKTTLSDLNMLIKYQEKIKDDVNVKLASLANIHKLLGTASLQKMYDDHDNHLPFMITVYRYNSLQMLQKHLPWLYHKNISHGFSYDYFPVAFETWRNAIINCIGAENAVNIVSVYEWMIAQHEQTITLSQQPLTHIDRHPELAPQRAVFTKSILSGDFEQSLNIAREVFTRRNGQELFYMGVIEPAMYEVGRLEELDIISYVEAHLATSMVNRLIAVLYSEIPTSNHKKGLGVITSAPNESHQLGARMLADLLEKEGWDIEFLDTDTPEKELITRLLKTQPKFLGISMTIVSHIHDLTQLISKLKQIDELSSLKIIVGGQGFRFDDKLWEHTGADSYCDHLKSAVREINQW